MKQGTHYTRSVTIVTPKGPVVVDLDVHWTRNFTPSRNRDIEKIEALYHAILEVVNAPVDDAECEQ